MTSNIGARQVKDFGSGVGFETSNIKSQASEIEKSVIQNALKKTFAPEFLNRIDDIVIFNTLEKEDIEKIVEIELVKLTKRVENLGYEVSLTKSAKKFISQKGFDKKYGARPLNRAIQKYIEDLLAENVVNNNIQEGSHITLDHRKGDEELHIKPSTVVNENKQ
jgi:ATP-dependent Clp protease ATP-binding subunit ClpC